MVTRQSLGGASFLSGLPEHSGGATFTFIAFLFAIGFAAFAGGCTALIVSGRGPQPVLPWPVSPVMEADLSALEMQA